MKVLLDTNVVVDVLQKRDPWFEDGKTIFLLSAGKQITGCISAKSLTDIHYFSRRQFKGEENTDERARQVIVKLLDLFEIIDTLGVDCKNAVVRQNNDYEDAVMIESAARAGVDCIVTRNTDHFKTSPLPVYTPKEFLSFISEC